MIPEERRRYRFWGLEVDSEIPLPEWSPFERAAGGEPDVVIALRGDEPAVEAPEKASVTARDGAILLGLPAAGWYRVPDGSRIEVTPARDAGEREVRLFLLGSAWGALCYVRGLLPLHASLVECDGGAIAICGPSGSGKSTLAAALSRLGHRVLGDDLCRAALGDDGDALVWPGAPRLKLWSEALAALDWSRADLERDHFRIDKFHVPLEASPSPDPVPLRALYLLEWGEARLAPLEGKEALRRLVASATYRSDLLSATGRVESHWQLCLDLVRRVPVRLLSRPRDLTHGERVARRLSDSLRTPA